MREFEEGSGRARWSTAALLPFLKGANGDPDKLSELALR